MLQIRHNLKKWHSLRVRSNRNAFLTFHFRGWPPLHFVSTDVMTVLSSADKNNRCYKMLKKIKRLTQSLTKCISDVVVTTDMKVDARE